MKSFGAFFTIAFFILVFTLADKSGRKPASNERSLADLNYRRSYISLDDNIEFSGLTHKPGEDADYVRHLLGQLIQKADRIAGDWKDTHPEIYHTFLLAALTVPMHESTLMHFTRRDPDEYCYFSNDIIVDIPVALAALENESPSRTQEIRLSNARFIEKNIPRFFRALAQGEDIFKSCDQLRDHETVQQILFSNDYADIGLMMLNSTSHGDFFASKKIFHVDEVINYGLSFLYDGYESIVTNVDQYACLEEVRENAKSEFYRRLIKGAWAGKYNSGNVSRTCRFTNPNHRFARNDEGFERNMQKLLTGTSVYHQYLPVDSYERNFFIELVRYHFEPEKMGESLDQILVSNYLERENLIQENEIDHNQEVILEPEISNNQPSINAPEDDSPESEVKEKPKQVIAREDPLPEIANVPEPVRTEIPLRVDRKGVFDGVRINIRLLPELSSDGVCGNSSSLDSNIEFSILGISGDFFEIENSLGLESCGDAVSLFIHKDYIIEKNQALPKNERRVRLESWVSIRDNHGLSESTILYPRGPGELVIIDEYIYRDQHVWLSFIDSKGDQVWFYAGEVNNLKTEDIE